MRTEIYQAVHYPTQRISLQIGVQPWVVAGASIDAHGSHRLPSEYIHLQQLQAAPSPEVDYSDTRQCVFFFFFQKLLVLFLLSSFQPRVHCKFLRDLVNSPWFRCIRTCQGRATLLIGHERQASILHYHGLYSDSTLILFFSFKFYVFLSPFFFFCFFYTLFFILFSLKNSYDSRFRPFQVNLNLRTISHHFGHVLSTKAAFLLCSFETF